MKYKEFIIKISKYKVKLTETNAGSAVHNVWIHFSKNDYPDVCWAMEEAGIDVKTESYTLKTKIHCGVSREDWLEEIISFFEKYAA
jgi:hypothetical protein